MDRKILLLGLLREHEMYGYQINDMIEAHLKVSIHLTKPTAYRLLHNMAEDGWITFREEQAGNRPTRRIYTITGKGEAHFLEMLKESLSRYEPADRCNTGGLAFLDTLAPEEAIPLLKERRAVIESTLSRLSIDEAHQGGFQLVIENQARHLEAELAWMDEVIAHIQATFTNY